MNAKTNKIRVTEDIPILTRSIDIQQTYRDFLEITELIESLELTDIVKGKAKLFMGGTEGKYTIYPIDCKITAYTKRQRYQPQGSIVPIKDILTKFDYGVRIERVSPFSITQVTFYFQAPEEISQWLEEMVR